VTQKALLDAWEYPEGVDVGSMAEIARDGLTPPDLRAQVISARGEVLTLQVSEGSVTPHQEYLLYVRDHGVFQVLRREEWTGGRVLVTLVAWRAH
jgi:hypothetical protein